jgi:hypothetical protein
MARSGDLAVALAIIPGAAAHKRSGRGGAASGWCDAASASDPPQLAGVGSGFLDMLSLRAFSVE